MIVAYKPSNDSVIEPNMLDLLPPPGDCNQAQRETAIAWYVGQPMDKLGEYMGNTQQRIYQEYYGKPHKKAVGQKLYNLYAMRDIIREAMRQKGAPTHGGPQSRTAALDAWIAERAAEEKAAEKMETATAANFVSLDKIDVIRASRTGTSS